MMKNCTHHLIDEVKLLKPKLVVFHGVNARWIIPDEFKARGFDLVALGDVKDEHGPVIYETPALGAHILFLKHSAYGNLAKQWEAVVVPALNCLRHRDLIPA
jgi:hypothetical protein